MICDAHIHIGQFYNIYTHPKELAFFLDLVGVDRFSVSSTSICEGNHKKVLKELFELRSIMKDRMFPVLWIIPQMLDTDGLRMFIDSELPWKCLKIHPQLHPTEWDPFGKNMGKVLHLAKKLKLPILIHTGDFEFCHAGLYLQLASENPDILFILAHGRPIDETIKVMKTCDNVYTDTAFMPTENIAKLCSAELADRILWGTDYPIPKYFFRNESMADYYQSIVNELTTNETTKLHFDKITHLNFEKVFVNC